MPDPDNSLRAAERSLLAEQQFPLLRRLSISSLVVMLITAATLISLYRQDQIAEHREIAERNSEKTAIHLARLLDGQIYTILAASNRFDTQDLRMSRNIVFHTEAMKILREYGLLKLKLYNSAGVTIYSSAKPEIGRISNSPNMLVKALLGEVTSKMEFRDKFLSATGEMHDLNVVLTYMPLHHAGKRIGAIEIYSDANPIIKHIQAQTIQIALVVFCAFTALYAALFFYVRRTDRAVAQWQKIIAKYDEKISGMAFYDALTRLPNRHLLEDRLAQTMAASKRSGLYGALMFLDLDNFKPINDKYGHCAGDLVLVEAARRINDCMREVDTVARFGGDEFVVMLGELAVDKGESTVQASIVAEKIRTILGKPCTLKFKQNGKEEITVEYHCTPSIGVVLFNNHETSLEDILKSADMAMYQAKEAGGNQIRFYNPNL